MKNWIAAVLLAGTNLLGQNWYKGQLHCHTTNSDGGFTPVQVCSMYAAAGYDFISVTDHHKATRPESFGPLPAGLLVIYGLEISAGRITHLNGFDVPPNSAIYPYDDSIRITRPMLDRGIDTLFSIGANLVQINHPDWSIIESATAPGCLQAIASAEGAALLEVLAATRDYNGVRDNEEVWDTVLSRAKIIWGTGTDDFHTDPAEFNLHWVMVNAPSLTKEAILAALAAGDFYASSGPALSQITRQDNTLAVESSTGVSVAFIGAQGRILRQIDSASARYTLTGNELYVRARVADAGGKTALTQPLFNSGAVARETAGEKGGTASDLAAWPNPFNPAAVIVYNVGPQNFVALQLKIYTAAGKCVATLVDGRQLPGTHSVTWNAAGRPSGIYIARLQAGTAVAQKRLLLIK